MNTPDTVTISADQNPAMFAEIKKGKVGDKGKCECQYQIKENAGDDSAVLLVSAWVPEGYEVADEGEEAETPTPVGMSPSEPNMTPAAMQVRKKKGK